MKPRLFTATMLFISAYAPLFLILAVKDFDFCVHEFKHPTAIYLLLALTGLSIVLLFVTVANIKRGSMVVKVRAVRDRSTDLINYTIPYILSFLGFDLSRPEDVISLTIFLLILLLLTIKSNAVFLNPILAARDYGLYELEYEFDGKVFSCAVLSKHILRVDARFYVRSLTRFLYFVTEEVKEDQYENQ